MLRAAPLRQFAVGVAGFAALAAGLSPGCARRKVALDPCAGEVPAVLEYRKQAGELVAVLRAGLPSESGAPRAFDPSHGQPLCDGSAHLLGMLSVTNHPPGIALKNAAGDAALQLARASGSEDATLTSTSGTYRLHDEHRLLRVLDTQGVPLGQVGHLDGKAIAYDPGGRPIASATRPDGAPTSNTDRLDGDPLEATRLVVRAPDGSVTHFVLGLHQDRAAALFAIDKLGIAERVLLARFLDDN